jgi:hypothetical protein
MKEHIISLVEEVFTDKKRKEALFGFLGELDLDNPPASSKLSYHHCYPGGLAAHIVEVYGIAKSLVDGLVETGNLSCTDGSSPLSDTFEIDEESFSTFHCLSYESLLMVAILHDIHKCVDLQGHPQYEANILKSGSVSEKIPYKVNKNCFAYKDIMELDVGGGEPDAEAARSLNWLLYNDKIKIKNGGCKSLALIAGDSPELLSYLTPYELDAIEYHGGAYETHRFELAGKENPLMIIFHAADMLSSRFGKSK